jgi:hypothetical protein
MSVNVESACVFRSGTQYVCAQICVWIGVDHVFYVIVYMMSVWVSVNDYVFHCVWVGVW